MLLYSLSEPRVRLFQNKMGQRGSAKAHRFVALRFAGGNITANPSKKWSAREGFGARVVLTLRDGSKIMREHHVEDGYMTQHSGTMIVGLGAHETATNVEVRWPSGRVQVTREVAAGSLLVAHENEATSPTGHAFERRGY